jgi:alkaline phosphatase
VNSGSIIEPGTGVFVANAEKRAEYENITKQIVQSGTDVILSGGEEWFLPEGIEGRFSTGKRTDGLNLIDWAKDNGYTIVYDKYELKEAVDKSDKLLGVFAAIHTFNDKSEEELAELGLPLYNEDAPTLKEMTEAAVEVLSKNNQQFFLIVEEEGTDNFGNKDNASGMLYALKRADDAIGYVLDYMEENPAVTLITAADSEASGMELIGDPVSRMNPDEPLPENERNGAPIDGVNGTGTKPFMSKPDKAGVSLPFRIAWSTNSDAYGSVVSRTAGLNAEMMNGKTDNTDIYRIMYATLFGIGLK